MAAYLHVASSLSWHDRRRLAAATLLRRHGDPEDLGIDVLEQILSRHRHPRHLGEAWRAREAVSELMADLRPDEPVAFDPETGVLRQGQLEVRPSAVAMRRGPAGEWTAFGSAAELAAAAAEALRGAAAAAPKNVR